MQNSKIRSPKWEVFRASPTAGWGTNFLRQLANLLNLHLQNSKKTSHPRLSSEPCETFHTPGTFRIPERFQDPIATSKTYAKTPYTCRCWGGTVGSDKIFIKKSTLWNFQLDQISRFRTLIMATMARASNTRHPDESCLNMVGPHFRWPAILQFAPSSKPLQFPGILKPFLW